MTDSTPNQKCSYSPHLGPGGCLPAPNIFHLAYKFAKGKMFWNKHNSISPTRLNIYRKLRFAQTMKNSAKDFSLRQAQLLPNFLVDPGRS